jgi:hypothetical protein
VERVREICLSYPEVVEAEQFGRPWWKAGQRSFCHYGGKVVREDGVWRGRDGAVFNVTPLDQDMLIQDPRFVRTSYIGQHGWTTMTFGPEVDWGEVEELIDLAYRRVALKRMLRALDARTAS